MAVLFRLPLSIQVKWLPPPLSPPVYWTSIEKINLHGSLPYPPFGRWAHTDNWDLEMTYPLPSIFKKTPKGTKKWDVHQTIRKMFLKKKKFKKTPQYKSMIRSVQNGDPNPPQSCGTLEAVKNYFVRLKKAYKSMKKKGYLTQKELGNPEVEEVRLHVTRKGELCLGTGGNHRIRMAEILGIKNIPFLLRGIHKDWIISLSKKLNLPPDKAISVWIKQNFSKVNPNRANNKNLPTMKNSNNHRILFYIGSLLAGGKERRLLELITYLKKNTELEMMLVISINRIHFERFLKLGIPVKVLNNDSFGFSPKIITNFYRLCNSFQPDIIHTWGAKQSFYALPAVIGKNIPMINSQIASAPPVIRSFSVDNWINRMNFKFSKLILANSFAGVTAYQPPRHKTKVIYNGVSFDRFENLTDPAEVRAKYKVNTPHLVVMTASYSPNKNYSLFLKVAKKVTQLRSDICFLGVGAHDIDNPIYTALVENSSNEPNIAFPGRIDDVEELVNASDIGVLLSNSSLHGEGISNSVLEYMALGKPVIANDAGGTKELVHDQENGYLIKDQSEDEIAQMIIDLIDDPERRKRFGKTGRKFIEDFFSIEKMGKEFIKAYEKVLKKNIPDTTESHDQVWDFQQPGYIHERN
ncbi:glycosyltransferase [Echinicola sediminis]